MAENTRELQEKLINLLLHYKEGVDFWFESSLKKECFDESYSNILNAIIYAYENGAKLTRKAYLEFIDDLKLEKRKIITEEKLFINIFSLKVNFDDYYVISKKIYDGYLLENSLYYVNAFAKDIEFKGIKCALEDLNSNLNNLIEEESTDVMDIYSNITDYSDKFTQYLRDVYDGKIKKSKIIKCGIREIDDTMVTGFAPGILTLFCADVGAFKTTTMLNIGLNIWKQEENVLFVPLEMAYDQMYTKIISRETKIDSEDVYKQLLTKEQIDKIEEIQKSWKEYKKKFYVMKKGDRSSVSTIKHEIEKNIDIFKPSIVVIDYIGNLIPDKSRQGRNDLEIGDMLKDLRQMGQKMGFSIVSGAQLGREALKRIRKGNNDSSINSEDIRGSHEYAADADNIYALVPDPNNPTSRVQIYVVKSRNGKKVFQNGSLKGVLEVCPEISLIKSINDYLSDHDVGDILKKVENVDDLDFGDINIDENDDVFGGI